MLRVPAIITTVILLTISPVLATGLTADLSAALKGTKAAAVGVLVMRDGKVADIAVKGRRRNDRPDPVQPGDLWRIGSDGKPITATLIARLVDRGVLNWKTPLKQMLPQFAATMRPDYRGVTLVQLLSHQSGLPHDVSDMKLIDTLSKSAMPVPAQRLAIIARALQDKPVAPPGTKFSYSNTGFLIAAAIAERATGMSYEDLMLREIFAPLGMTSARITDPTGPEPLGHIKGKPVVNTADVFPLLYSPAGDWYLTLGDWAKFCLDQMAGVHGHGRLLKQATYRMMQSLQIKDENGGVGLGWGIYPSIMGYAGPFLEHTGSDETWYASVALRPATESGVLAVSNAGETMGGEKAANRALKAALREIAPLVTAQPIPH
ncbi:MAG TPA: serine hydrolase domain-containing protein [Rhizomicrobium sp.]|nr:serine hydrolase domain-containing protein [Rhizomicrobium sp.]